MLVLTRRRGERISIGEGVEVLVLEVRGSRVRLGITAPPGVDIFRRELLEQERLVLVQQTDDRHRNVQ